MLGRPPEQIRLLMPRVALSVSAGEDVTPMMPSLCQMLVSAWGGREDEVTALRQRIAVLEQRQGVWEAEAAMERAR